MSATESGAAASAAPGAIDALKAAGRTMVEIFHTRFELLSVEIEEEQGRLAELLLFGAMALLFLLLALTISVVFIVAAFWDTPYRLVAIGTTFVLTAGAGIACAVAVKRQIQTKPRVFAASLDALATDIERFK